jgi:hypothetical protein
MGRMAEQLTTTEAAFGAGFQLLTWRDARGGPARRVRAVVQALERDLGDDLPVAQRMLVQRAAVLASLCTHTEAVLLNGGRTSIADYVQMSATLARLLKLLGLRRVPRDVTTLGDLLRDDLEQKRARVREAEHPGDTTASALEATHG